MYVTRQAFFNARNFNTSRFLAASPLPAAFLQALGRSQPVQDNDSSVSTASPRPWSPQVDIREDEQRFVILADIPGIDPPQIEVSMDKGILSIKGKRERAAGIDNKAGKFSRVERVHGEFHRRFALPETADAEGITASGSHGVLEISIPKKALPTPRRITINSGH